MRRRGAPCRAIFRPPVRCGTIRLLEQNPRGGKRKPAGAGIKKRSGGARAREQRAAALDELLHRGRAKLTKAGDEYVGGQILDPDNGKVLNVRGYIGVPMLGRSQSWVRQE